jgi:hypothetical protein
MADLGRLLTIYIIEPQALPIPDVARSRMPNSDGNALSDAKNADTTPGAP